MRRRSILVLVLLLAVGFASVATNLIINGNLNIGFNQGDYRVYFSQARVNGNVDNSVITDDTHINFETSLSKVGETYVLDYEVTNGSFQYDVEVSIEKLVSDEEYLIVDNVFDTTKPLLSQNTRKGRLTIELKKATTEDLTLNVELVIKAEPISREEVGNAIYLEADTNDSYVENGIPYFYVRVRNYKGDQITASNVDYKLNFQNDESGATGLYYYVDGDGNKSSEDESYQSFIESMEYHFGDAKEERLFKVYVKSESGLQEHIVFNVSLASSTNNAEVIGTVRTPEGDFCLENGYYTLSDCMIARDSLMKKEDAIEVIRTRVADFDKPEPELVYTKKEEKNVNPGNTVTDSYYFTEEIPTLNKTTGHYTWSADAAKYGNTSDFISTDSKKYYTCLGQNSNGNCTTIYVIYEITNNKITKADILTQSVSDTAFASPGLYAAADDYGESYYYRGDVKNNYVSFANKIWRIVRRNGDGSVRLIYSGTSTKDTGANLEIGKSAFNNFGQDPAMVGYVYGLKQEFKHGNNSVNYDNINENASYYYSDSYTCENNFCSLTGEKINGKWKEKYTDIINTYKYTCWSTTATGTCTIVSEITGSVTTSGIFNPKQARVKYHGYLSSTYEDTYKDDQSSTIKGIVDNWYTSNIEKQTDDNNNTFASYLADTGFCSDRSIASDSPNKIGTTLDSSITYGAMYRLRTTKNPQLTCSREEDKLKVSNGKLSKPIALISADEVSLAGGRLDGLNSSYYLYSEQAYWTLSPYFFYEGNASSFAWLVSPSGSLSTTWTLEPCGVRPVINLSSDVLIASGAGTLNDPYVVTK